MNARRIERLVRLREHAERAERTALRLVAEELNALEAQRAELVAQRAREEDALREIRQSDPDALRRQHAHLFRMQLSIRDVDEKIRETRTRQKERESAWHESRREVKSLETLLERTAAKLAAAERRDEQKLLDSHAARRYAVQGGETP